MVLTMTQKCLGVLGVITFAIIAICWMSFLMPFINSNADLVLADPASNNFSYFRSAVDASRMWLFLLPLGTCGAAIIFILRAKEPGQ
jgi:hypothetical protein